ncbi:hypothetical protein B0T26DRAFT_731181 [Lasiosphaeria miniovina]|uniref:Uncharacterized protein n=1 Tax=Lasiosphaeria miniovina TaxID=1954250 RepID=A0AA39ZTQ8_9PEZI|nr:uncharacterized protein B0T26DRAFT_731181 [Lasiosphaeria miniovina]KAK0703403.1 hypothetical protein B0T26DRAFT_731181 [Lasiosphaeria miniovina]
MLNQPRNVGSPTPPSRRRYSLPQPQTARCRRSTGPTRCWRARKLRYGRARSARFVRSEPRPTQRRRG